MKYYGKIESPEDLTNKEYVDSALSAHAGDAVIHVNASERAAWNSKAEMSDIPSNVSELNNDSGYGKIKIVRWD